MCGVSIKPLPRTGEPENIAYLLPVAVPLSGDDEFATLYIGMFFPALHALWLNSRIKYLNILAKTSS